LTRKPHGVASPDKAYGKIAKVGAVWTIGRQSIGQVIHFAASVVLARLLTPYDFGLAAAVAFFLKLANKVGSLGLGGALVRLKEVRPEHVSSVFVVNLALGVGVWAVLTVSAPALARVFHNDAITPALRVAALQYLLHPFGVGQLASFNRQFQFKPMAAIEWINSVVFFAVSVSLAWSGWGYWSLIYGTLLASVTGTVLKIYLGDAQPRLRFSKEAFMEVIPFGIGLQVKRILTFCAEYLDTLVVGRVLGITSLGLYDKAFSTVDRVTDRLTAGPSVFFRIFAIIREEPERLRRAYRKSALAVSLVGIPSFAVLIVLGPELIPFVYGDQWRSSILPFQILCLAGAFRMSSAYASAVTQAQGRIWSEIARSSVYVTLVVAGAWLGAAWGIAGVAVGVAIANCVMSLLMQTLVCKLTDLRWREVFGPQLPALCIAGVFAVVMLGVQSAFTAIWPDAIEWHRLALKLAAAAVTGFVVFLRPPFQTVRDVRDEILHDLAPSVVPYLPAWAGVGGAHTRHATERPARAARAAKEGPVSDI
jgi:O-antigen/teichoic acid export membrane protein